MTYSRMVFEFMLKMSDTIMTYGDTLLLLLIRPFLLILRGLVAIEIHAAFIMRIIAAINCNNHMGGRSAQHYGKSFHEMNRKGVKRRAPRDLHFACLFINRRAMVATATNNC